MPATGAHFDDQLPGAVNLRDIGGLRAGTWRVRAGRVFRSGMTHAMPPESLDHLALTLGVRTVLDLRTPAEQEQGLADFARHGITHRSAPVIDGVGQTREEQFQAVMAMYSGKTTWAETYLKMLKQSGGAFRMVLETLAEPDVLPALIQCTGGRDRTGVATALLLWGLGVEPEEIAADYARTGGLLLPHLTKFAGFKEAATIPAEQLTLMIATPPRIMLDLLAALGTAYGSAAGTLAAFGVGAATLERLREALLEPEA